MAFTGLGEQGSAQALVAFAGLGEDGSVKVLEDFFVIPGEYGSVQALVVFFGALGLRASPAEGGLKDKLKDKTFALGSLVFFLPMATFRLIASRCSERFA